MPRPCSPGRTANDAQASTSARALNDVATPTMRRPVLGDPAPAAGRCRSRCAVRARPGPRVLGCDRRAGAGRRPAGCGGPGRSSRRRSAARRPARPRAASAGSVTSRHATTLPPGVWIRPCASLIAPDKFAGTLSAVEAAEAIAAGWRRRAPGDELEQVPMADGGPGFVDVLHAALGGDLLGVTVTDPYGEHGARAVLRVGGHGVRRVRAGRRPAPHPARGAAAGARHQPSASASCCCAAVGSGARRIVVGLGGSATNDGGAGAARRARRHRRPGPRWTRDPAALDGITAIDLAPAREALVEASSSSPPATSTTRWPGCCGATKIYGPQKGLPEERLLVVDGWLEQLGIAADRRTAAAKGAGAAGGIGFALLLLGAVREPGVEMVAAAVGLADRIRGADLVVTGEGAFDFSSRSGKVPYGVAQLCAEGVVPCVALAGQVLDRLPRDAHPRRRVGVLRGRPGGGGARVRRPGRLPGPAGRAHRAHLVPLTRPLPARGPGPDGSPGFGPDRGRLCDRGITPRVGGLTLHGHPPFHREHRP